MKRLAPIAVCMFLVALSTAAWAETPAHGVRVLRTRTVQKAGGHLFTIADVLVDGHERHVTAPGGRLGARSEWVGSTTVPGAAPEVEWQTDGLWLADHDGGHTTSASAGPGLMGPAWSGCAMAVRYRVNLAGGRRGATPEILAGFDTWEDRKLGFMDFAYAGSTPHRATRFDSDNVVYFGPLESTKLGVTYLYWYGAGPIGFDMVLTTNYPLVTGPERGFDLQSLVAHEAGHAAGIGHSSNQRDVMYPSLTYGTTKRTLGPGDRTILARAYPTTGFGAQVVSVKAPPDHMRINETAQVSITFRNVGPTPWGGAMPPAELHTDEPEDRSSSFADASWKADNRPADAGPAACPGRLTTVRWTMHAPLIPISYTESFALVGHPATGYFRASNPVRFTIQVGLI